MKSFQITIDFRLAPENISMEDAKGLAIEGVKSIPNTQKIKDGGKYCFELSGIEEVKLQ